MLTLDSDWLDEFERAEVEPVYLVQFYTTTGDPLAFCTGNRILDFAGIYNPFTGGTSGAKTAYPSIAAVTPLAIDLDPFERTINRNSATISFHDDGPIRDFIASTRLLNRNVSIKLGTANLTTELDWAPVFRGLVSKIETREGVIDIECRDFFHYTEKPYYGNWVNKHPLEVMKKLLEDQGVPSGFIDADTFDPTDSDYASIAHYVVTHWSSGPILNPINVTGQHRVGYEPIKMAVQTICEDLAKAMVGSVFFQEDGKAKFLKFDTGATVRAHWGPDQIQDFAQLETIIINEIDAKVTGAWLEEEDIFEGNVRFKDTASQSNFAFPGESNGVFAQSVGFNLMNFQGVLQQPVTSTGGITLRVQTPFGLSGSRVTGNYTAPGPWESLQASGTNLAVSRPLYVLVDSEVMKCVSMDLVENAALHPNEFNNAGTGTNRDVPEFADLTITSGNRGALSTVAATHTLPGEGVTLPAGRVFDVTLPRDFALVQLQRFSNGVAVIELTTSLREWAVQVGDLVTVENDVFLEFGSDGLTSSTSWEVIGKELRLDDSNASIKWRLAYATKSSPPSIIEGVVWDPDWIRRGVGVIPEIVYANEVEVGISRHVVKGLNVSVSSGLVVTVNAGAAAKGGRAVPYQTATNYTVTASKDHYFSYDTRIGAVSVQTVSAGAYAPEIGPDSVMLALVDAGPSAVSITDLRNFGAVRPRNMSALDFEAGQNLIWNPGFETWSRGSSYPPDHWELGAGLTWLTNALRDSGDAERGEYCLRLVTGSCIITSSLFPVEYNRVYLLGGAVIPTASGITIQVGIQWYNTSKALLSTEYVINASGFSNSSYTQKNAHVVAPATAAFAKIYLSRDNESGQVLYDSLRLVRAMPSFHAVVNGAQTITNGSTDAVEFNVEVHDIGSQYDHATCYDFTAKFDGIYEFKAQVRADSSGAVTSFTPEVRLVKNGSTVVCVGISANDGNQSSLWQFLLSPGPIKLAADDTIEVQMLNNTGKSLVLQNSSEDSWFMGIQVH